MPKIISYNFTMKKFLKKFQLKWWSWEIDTVKLLPFIIFVLAFLPILPYEKKDGQLISVMGIEAKENNFYLRLSDFSLITNLEIESNISNTEQIKYKPDSGSVMALISSYIDKNGDIGEYAKYLETTNYSENLKQCLILRNMLMSDLVFNSELQRLYYLYIPSPVPAIWFFRIIIVHMLEVIGKPYFPIEMLQKGSKKCGEFKHLWPSEKYLDLTFE